MVEMRWVWGSEPAPELGENMERGVKVLQYRYQIDKAQWGPLFSEWIDVPTVEEVK